MAAPQTRKSSTRRTSKTQAQPQAEAPTQDTPTAPAEGEATPNTEAATATDGPTAETTAAQPEATNQPEKAPEPKQKGKGKGKPDEIPAVFVRTGRGVKSRRRAGFRFSREGLGIALEALSDEQLEKLHADPALEVEACTFPADDDGEAEQ